MDLKRTPRYLLGLIDAPSGVVDGVWMRVEADCAEKSHEVFLYLSESKAEVYTPCAKAQDSESLHDLPCVRWVRSMADWIASKAADFVGRCVDECSNRIEELARVYEGAIMDASFQVAPRFVDLWFVRRHLGDVPKAADGEDEWKVLTTYLDNNPEGLRSFWRSCFRGWANEDE